MFDAALRALIGEALQPLIEKIERLEAALVSPPADPAELLTVAAAAKERGVSAAAIYKALSRGHIKATRVGTAVRIARRELHR